MQSASENGGGIEALPRIQAALAAAVEVLQGFRADTVRVEHKPGAGPVTEADRAVNDVLARMLPGEGEGWLSEESRDDPRRLEKRRVWAVDPLDGTREFVAGIPEWCVSVGLLEDGRAVAGGVANPATGETFLGSLASGVTYNGRPARVSGRASLPGALVLASRSEVDRGEWERFRDAVFTVRAVGSVAYKLALVAAGLADATWTLVPKHEWDVAAGVALVLAAGGSVHTPDGSAPRFNQPLPLLSGLVAETPALLPAVKRELGLP
ncbi:MAG TPA: 3'(2'),5'-bisphosphate nucleotidase CysQ [Gemmatimonadales bacterium]|nr:3'(2'),5'-bisphosphate nucleotidase CysQ [Gemmatimonadales bacterium]